MADTPESSPKKKSGSAQLATSSAAMPANSSKFSIQSLLGLGEGGSKPGRGGSVSSNTSEDDAELQYDLECPGEYIHYAIVATLLLTGVTPMLQCSTGSIRELWGAGPPLVLGTSDDTGDFPLSKRFRTNFSIEQLRALEYSFRLCHYPDIYTRELLARYTGIDENRIQVAVTGLDSLVNCLFLADMVPKQKSKIPQERKALTAHFNQ